MNENRTSKSFHIKYKTQIDDIQLLLRNNKYELQTNKELKCETKPLKIRILESREVYKNFKENSLSLRNKIQLKLQSDRLPDIHNELTRPKSKLNSIFCLNNPFLKNQNYCRTQEKSSDFRSAFTRAYSQLKAIPKHRKNIKTSSNFLLSFGEIPINSKSSIKKKTFNERGKNFPNSRESINLILSSECHEQKSNNISPSLDSNLSSSQLSINPIILDPLNDKIQESINSIGTDSISIPRKIDYSFGESILHHQQKLSIYPTHQPFNTYQLSMKMAGEYDMYEKKVSRDIAIERNARKLNTTQIIKAMKNALHYLKKLNLSLDETIKFQVFSYKPYQKKFSYELISCSKTGDFDRIKRLLKISKFLVYDFDYFYQTSLHWACRRGNYRIAKILIKYGSDIDARDIVGRTPLFFALKYENLEIAKLLLVNGADPFSNDQISYKEVIKNYKIKSLMRSAIKFHIAMKMSNPELRKKMWDAERFDVFDVRTIKKNKLNIKY